VGTGSRFPRFPLRFPLFPGRRRPPPAEATPAPPLFWIGREGS
jgi:hypothetical protein